MTQRERLAEHHATATVNAPVHQVYTLFSHFNDFPKFMTFVKEVTYYDEQNSHWVTNLAGSHEWDAVNEQWIEDRQIGWRSTRGLENTGRVTFQPAGANQTRIDVYVNYNPPAGVLGDIGENVGIGKRFDAALQEDLDHFARMVDQAPPGALDPLSSDYLFRQGSAATTGTTTDRQDVTMGNNPAQDRDTSMATDYPTSYTTADTNYPAQTAGTGYPTGSSTSMGTSDTTDSGYNPASGAAAIPVYPSDSSASMGTNYTPDPDAGVNRPVLDRDIIAEPSNIVADQPTQPLAPPSSSSNQGNIESPHPILPPEDLAQRNPVMPPEDTAKGEPILPPEREKDTSY